MQPHSPDNSHEELSMEILETVEKHTNNGFMRYIKAADDKMFFNNSSIWLKRFAKFLVLILLMIGVWLGKAYGTVKKKKKKARLVFLQNFKSFIIFSLESQLSVFRILFKIT